MMTFLRWLWRVLFALLVVLLLGGIWVSWKFEQWKKDRLAVLDAGSQIVETTVGPIEFTDVGTGPVVLVSHGAPGGYDQAALLGAFLAKNGFRVIAPSRPGFLRTPLETGLLFEDQGDAMAALLDKLGIKSASVLGVSTGAQVATQFALRHPDRTDALVLVSPVTLPYWRDPEKDSHELLAEAAVFKTTGDMGAWLFVEKAKSDPRWMLDNVLKVDTTLDSGDRDRLTDFVLKDPTQLEFFRSLICTLAPLEPRESGTRNDLLQLRAIEPIPYENLQPPVLLVHGDKDAAAKWTDLKPITEKLPSAKVAGVPDAGEIVWLGPGAAAMERAVVDFLKQPPARRPAPQPSPTPVPATGE